MKKVKSIILLSLLCSLNLSAMDDPFDAVRSNTGALFPGRTYNQGRYISSKGNIKALAIFVQFRGDKTSSTEWPADEAPSFLNTLLDSSLDQTSVAHSFSDYYRKMSNDSLRIYGKGCFAITQHAESYYRDTLKKGNNAFGFSTKEVLASLNSQINYADYDHWTFGSGSHSNTPDGKVDLIIVLYRNSIFPSGPNAQGIALLGQSVADTALDGKTIGFDFWRGSGITMSGGFHGMPAVLVGTKHEFGHRLFGGDHPRYEGYTDGGGQQLYSGMWGILPLPGNCANAYEREKMGWITPITVRANTVQNLSDYVTTGIAVKIPIPGDANTYYYLENHRQWSIYDSEVDQINGQGLMIYKVSPFSGDHPTYNVEMADGKFEWANPYWIPHPFGGKGELPVFQKLQPNRNGYDYRDYIPHTRPGFSGGKFEIYMIDSDGVGGQPYYFFNGWKGNGNTGFRMNTNRVFAPWTNPGSGNNKNISVAILADRGTEMQVRVDVQDITITQDSSIPAETFEFSDNIIVPAGVTLTIQAGATLKFAPGKSLVVNGILNATGTFAEPITFDRSGRSGTWGGLRFETDSWGGLNYCNIHNATNGVYSTSNTKPLVQNCKITNAR